MINLFISSKSSQVQRVARPDLIEFVVVDLFCGAGGTTTGFMKCMHENNPTVLVAACVNHDPKALESHWKNHPQVVHYEEDIRTLELSPLVSLIYDYRKAYPHAKIVLWASLECTNFSKAKGGLPRDADSRTLADHLDRYIIALNPDYIKIENVVEFMSWGPLDSKGKPVSRKNGADWVRWREYINSLGYWDDWRELNSADFGAYTSRNRLFGCFAKHGLPIKWPTPTHAKFPDKQSTLFGQSLKKWNAVKVHLDFSDKGASIFNRKKPLVDATLERIEAGLIKFVAGGKEAFMLKYNSMAANGDKKHCAVDIDKPANTISCQVRTNVCFISKHFSGRPEGKVISIEGPAGTIMTADSQSLVSVESLDKGTESFLASYYGKGDNIRSVEDPAPTLTTVDRCAVVNPSFISREYKTPTNSSVEEPLGALLTVPKASLVTAEPFIFNPSYGGHCTSVNNPCVVIVARQDKSPLYLVQYTIDPNILIPIYDTDSEVMVRIKKFMALYGLADIKMRMLKISELLPIQGFPKDYKLVGNQTEQKKFIGNSVVPNVVTSWANTLVEANRNMRTSA